MHLRENGRKGIGDRKYRLFLRVLLVKVNKKVGWPLEGKRSFLLKMEELTQCIQSVLLEMIKQRGKMNGHLELMAMNLKRDSEPCPVSEGLV